MGGGSTDPSLAPLPLRLADAFAGEEEDFRRLDVLLEGEEVVSGDGMLPGWISALLLVRFLEVEEGGGFTVWKYKHVYCFGLFAVNFRVRTEL